MHPVFWFVGGIFAIQWFAPALADILYYIVIGLFVVAMIREHMQKK